MISTQNAHKAKPFLKWAGGKSQLLTAIEGLLPSSFTTEPSITYIEPFVGGGALMFHLLQKYPNITKAVINDINPRLIHTYQVIRDYSEELIGLLSHIQRAYSDSDSVEEKRNFFLSIRERFNNGNLSIVEEAAYMIFLNRTCFNGLYRENSKGDFNVSFGRYVNPTILDENLIRTDSELLQRVEILQGDFSQIESYVSDYTFIYFDPPYRPISTSAAFTSYHKRNFNDAEQYRLKEFYTRMSEKGCKVLLSNSDGTSADPDNTYIDDLYRDFFIHRVMAKRSISCAGAKRGPIPELLIKNYRDHQREIRMNV